MEYTSENVVERLNNNRAGTVWEVLDIKLVSADENKVVATMPVGPNQRQQVGYLHGGVSVVLAESLASLGTVLGIDQERQMAFGLEINANHLRPKREGMVTGTAVPLFKGRTTQVWEIKITDEDDRLICISRCTVAVVNRSSDV